MALEKRNGGSHRPDWVLSNAGIFKEYGIESVQRNGVYRDDNEYNTTNHVWLLVYDEIIIDLTVGQFPFGLGILNGLYFGKENIHYRNMENTRTQRNYDIINDERLLNDYNIIMEYMP